MIKVQQIEDTELLEEILKQLKDNDYYCPCSLTRTPDDKCMCAKFRNQINQKVPGECDCGRYIITTN